ncbi:MAG: hypothetical protein GYB65_00315 [Chloroflexi bacterium]|nr:hypothetical protein [Chloroflexota bacterium]
MVVKILADYIPSSPDEIERLLALPAEDIYRDPAYMDLVRGLDEDELQRTARLVREVYDERLEPIKEKHGLSGTIMSGFTLGNWVIGLLMMPDRLPGLLEKHANLSPQLIAETLPDLIELLEYAPAGQREWQEALVVRTLPLLAPNGR